MTDPQTCLRTYLEGARDVAGKLPTEYHYRNVYDFVLREGRFFEPQPQILDGDSGGWLDGAVCLACYPYVFLILCAINERMIGEY